MRRGPFQFNEAGRDQSSAGYRTAYCRKRARLSAQAEANVDDAEVQQCETALLEELWAAAGKKQGRLFDDCIALFLK